MRRLWLRSAHPLLTLCGWAVPLLLFAIIIRFERTGCILDTAHIEFVEPETVRVLAVYQCGGLTCWERWIDLGGVRKRVSMVCEPRQGDTLQPGS